MLCMTTVINALNCCTVFKNRALVQIGQWRAGRTDDGLVGQPPPPPPSPPTTGRTLTQVPALSSVPAAHTNASSNRKFAKICLMMIPCTRLHHQVIPLLCISMSGHEASGAAAAVARHAINFLSMIYLAGIAGP